MVAHRLRAQIQVIGYLGVLEPLGDQVEDLALPVAQLRKGVHGLRGSYMVEVLGHPHNHRWAELRLATADGANHAQHLQVVDPSITRVS